jgi:hypothetical protein
MIMRKTVVAGLASGVLLLGSNGTAVAANAPVSVKIGNNATFEITDPNFSQIAVSLKVTCDPALSSVSLNVLVDQGSVSGFGFVSGASCTGKALSVTAHVQSNFGSVYVPGPARVRVNDFQYGNQFQEFITIR